MDETSDLHDRDFVRWSQEQAVALRSAARSGTNLPLDWEHLAEEIDDLGRALRSELHSRLATVVEHLLKLAVSPATDPRRGWIETVARERVEIETLLEDNPSLALGLTEAMMSAERKGRKLARISLDLHGEFSHKLDREIAKVVISIEDIRGHKFPAHVIRDKT